MSEKFSKLTLYHYLFEINKRINEIIGNKCIVALILYGSALSHGYREESDIDLILITYDSCSFNRKVLDNVISEYKKLGVTLSLNVIPLSELLSALLKGDSLAIKAISTGYPIVGYEIVESLKKYIKKNLHKLQPDKKALLEVSETLVMDAIALVNITERDLYSACGRVKTALGYLLVLKTGIFDPEEALKVETGRISQLYQEISSLCHLILRGDATISQIKRKILEASDIVKETILTLENSDI